MVYAEATVALPLVAGYAYHKGNWKNRQARDYAKLFDQPATTNAKELAAV
jgi:deoxyhypusine synthase